MDMLFQEFHGNQFIDNDEIPRLVWNSAQTDTNDTALEIISNFIINMISHGGPLIHPRNTHVCQR